MIEISVIIPTRNRSLLLEKTLVSLLSQSISEEIFEVIVVDNNSTDATKTVAEKYARKLNQFRYIKELKPGLHEGRHSGLQAAKGKILVYIDDDVEALPEWLAGIYESFKNDAVGLVGGKAIPLYESEPPQWLEKLWEKTPYGKMLPHLSLLDFGDDVREVDPHFVFGCNFSIRADLLIKIGGFHPDGMPDALLKYRGDGETFVARQVALLGYKVIYNPKASLKHWVPNSRMNLDYIRKRVFMFGIGNSYTDARSTRARPSTVETLMARLKRFKRLIMASGLQKEILRSFYKGYDFHQSEMQKDKELEMWVLKEDYLPDDFKKWR